MSFIAFIVATTSILSNGDFEILKKSGIIENLKQVDGPVLADETNYSTSSRKGLKGKLKSTSDLYKTGEGQSNMQDVYRIRISKIKKMNDSTPKEKSNKERAMLQMREDFKDKIDKNKLNSELGDIKEEENEDEIDRSGFSGYLLKDYNPVKYNVKTSSKDLPRPSEIFQNERKEQIDKLLNSEKGSSAKQIM